MITSMQNKTVKELLKLFKKFTLFTLTKIP